MKLSCSECRSELKLFSHEFSNKTVHCKAICPRCFWSTFAPRSFLTSELPKYDHQDWLVLKKNRKKALRQRRGEGYENSQRD